MDRKHLMNLQLFADGGAGGDGGNPGTDTNAPNGGQAAQGNQGGQNTEQIVSAVLSAIEERQKRAGNAVAKSMAEQYGMNLEELTALLEAKQKENAAKLSPEAQAQIDAANKKMHDMQLAADVAKKGAEMGLVDVDAAIALMDKNNIKYSETGVEGVQEALDALKTAKGYLFSQPKQQGAWGQQRQGGAPGSAESVDDEMRKAMFGK